MMHTGNTTLSTASKAGPKREITKDIPRATAAAVKKIERIVPKSSKIPISLRRL